MENFSLDGFQLIHPSNDGILHERRVILGLTQKQVGRKQRSRCKAISVLKAETVI